MISILLVYRTQSWCLELTEFLDGADDLHVVGAVDGQEQLVVQVNEYAPDVVLVASHFPHLFNTLRMLPTLTSIISLASPFRDKSTVAQMNAIGTVYPTPVTSSLIDLVRESVWRHRSYLLALVTD